MWNKQLTPLLVALGLTASIGCGADCVGDACGCEGQHECIVSCERDGCDIGCKNTGASCGAVCGDDCTFECSDSVHCSSYSGVDSDIECHGVSSCAAECGAGCFYEAYDVSEVHVTVGDESTVICRQLSSCEVTCRGRCEVTCESLSSCEVSCEAAETVFVTEGSTRRCE